MKNFKSVVKLIILLCIRKIYYKDLEKYVTAGFSDDQDLVDKYHIKGCSLKECVSSTMQAIEETCNQTALYLYGMEISNKPIGFCAVGYNFLYSFGVNKNYRTSEIINSWWQWIEKKLYPCFSCVLYKKNTRAISFLERQSMNKISQDNETVTLFKTY